MHEIMVSVAVATYNQENFISQCLDSIIMQKTDFAFEIIVHDDASKDRTADIVKEYARKYPDIVKPILQTENQYSQNKEVFLIATDIARGKYVASCEGDDYWTDKNKLQTQVNYMEAHEDCTLCCHTAVRFSDADKKEIGYVRPTEKDRILSLEEIICEGGGYIAFNTMLYRRTDYDNNRPAFCWSASISDYPMCFYLAEKGYAYCFAKSMSAYRVNVNGSWSSTVIDTEKRCVHFNRIISMLEEANEYYNRKYAKIFKEAILRTEFTIHYYRKDWDEMLRLKYRRAYKKFFNEPQYKYKVKRSIKKLLKR